MRTGGDPNPRDPIALAAMGRRIVALEREHAAMRDRADTLASLQRTFVRMAGVRDPTEILTTMLNAAKSSLGFSRAIVFSVERESGIEARLEVDGSDVIEASSAQPDLRNGSAFLSILRERIGVVYGEAHELSAPIVDVRRWYVASPLFSNRDVSHILYVDGHASNRMHEEHATLVRELATISAVMHERAIAFQTATELASRDALTGLLNRRGFDARVSSVLEKAANEGHAYTYVLLDIDDFKQINDLHGHLAGDAILRQVAETLVSSSRNEDIVGRYAGDEFNVLLATVDRNSAHRLVARLSKALRERNLSCSLGAARFPEDAVRVADLIRAADVALYRAKLEGKCTFRFYHDASP